MNNDFVFLFIMLIHYLADFAMQTNEQSIKKSTSNKFLIYHVLVYCLIWMLALVATHDYTKFTAFKVVDFVLITFIFHFCTDFISSRIGKSFWEKKDLHNGFCVVGFDQISHYVQLWFTFKFLINGHL